MRLAPSFDETYSATVLLPAAVECVLPAAGRHTLVVHSGGKTSPGVSPSPTEGHVATRTPRADTRTRPKNVCVMLACNEPDQRRNPWLSHA